MDYLPKHVPCFAHTLQLVVKDGGSISNTINTASKLVSYIRHSTLVTELFENDIKLQAKNETRWNSDNKMLKSILKADPANMEMLDYSGKLTKYEMKILEEITEILNPFEIATDQCQGQDLFTASLILPCIRGIRSELTTLSSTYKSKFVTTLILSLNTRFARYEQNEGFQMAAIFGLRWKLDWCKPDEVSRYTNPYRKNLITIWTK